MNEENYFLVNRLNYDPIVFMGCSEKEIYAIIAIIAGPLLTLGGVMGLLLWGNIPFGMLPAFILSSIGIISALKVVKKLKRDKEPGYLKQQVSLFAQKHRLIRTPIIRRNGSWLTGRMVK
tara:strand:- start:64 stop:423 length:360 start_codon:yes stop_codon:yes gene_type:complete